MRPSAQVQLGETFWDVFLIPLRTNLAAAGEFDTVWSTRHELCLDQRPAKPARANKKNDFGMSISHGLDRLGQ
jgi:hypothetical protein